MSGGPRLDDLYYWRYRLTPRRALSHVSGRTDYEGCLLRSGVGVGCVHPWPELGDAPLDEQLAALERGEPLALGRRALDCIALDAAAREDSRSLFEGLTIPRSHWTLGADLNGLPPDIAVFSAVKLKGPSDPDKAATRVEELCGRLPDSVRVRLDFNEAMSMDGFLSFWRQLRNEVRDRIEFVEDPVPHQEAAWMKLVEETGACLALDRAGYSELNPASVIVIKPALQKWSEDSRLTGKMCRGVRLVFTSYMDHPVGQTFAAYEAALFEKMNPGIQLDAGLLTHELFEPEGFVEQLRRSGPQLQAPEGTGLGFDELLEALPWKRLY